MKLLYKLAPVGFIALAVLNLLPHLGLSVLSEWAASFLPFLLVYTLPAAGLLWILKLKWQWFLLLLPLLLWNLILLWPYLFPGALSEFDRHDALKVCAVNVHRINHRHQPIVDAIKKQKPDLVFVQEIDKAWEESLRAALSEDYSFIHAIPDDFNFGVMLLSKIPIQDLKVAYTTEYEMPYYNFRLDFKGKDYHFLAMHTYPPSSPSKLPWRNEQLALLGKLATANSIVMGDFNTATFSPAFRKLLKVGNLQDPRCQAGILNTWHAKFPFLGSNIDHILVRKDLHYGKLKRLQDIGSDHLPLLLEIK